MKQSNVKKQYIVLISILICIFVFEALRAMSVDNCFMYLHFEDILQGNLFRKTDFLTVHEGLPFSHQKWAMCFLTYIVRNAFGFFGWHIFAVIFNAVNYAILAVVITKLNPKNLSANILLLIFPYMLGAFTAFRPHIISSMLVVLEIYYLEQFSKGELSKKKLWISLFWISLVTMWFHSTMWPLVVITILPYLFSFDFLCFKKIKGSVRDIWIGFAILLSASILQPNGFSQYKYMWICCSALSDKLKNSIRELNSFNFNETSCLIYLTAVLVGIFVFIVCIRHQKMSCSHLFLAAGYLVLGFMSIRMIPLSISVFAIVIAIIMNDAKEESVKLATGGCDLFSSKKIFNRVTTVGVIIAICNIGFIAYAFNANYDIKYSKGFISDYFRDSFKTEDLSKDDMTNIRLWSVCFNTMASLELYGVTPYMDSRAELFTGAFGGDDVITEYNHTLAVIEENDYAKTLQEFEMLQSKYNFDYYMFPAELVEACDSIKSLETFADCVEMTDDVCLYKVR